MRSFHRKQQLRHSSSRFSFSLSLLLKPFTSFLKQSSSPLTIVLITPSLLCFLLAAKPTPPPPPVNQTTGRKRIIQGEKKENRVQIISASCVLFTRHRGTRSQPNLTHSGPYSFILQNCNTRMNTLLYLSHSNEVNSKREA